MKGLMLVGFVLFMTIQVMPLSAQLDCWQKIQTCVKDTASPVEFQQQCCALLLEEITNEIECFCSVKSIFLQNATVAGFVSQLVSLCSTTSSFITLCPDAVSSPVETPPPPPPVQFSGGSCWEEVDNCVGNNVNRSEGEPRLNPSSPTFNVTEFLCCPLMQQKAVNEKQCFCSINTFVKENPSFATNITLVLSTCDIVAPSADSLNSFCLGGAPDSSTPTTQSLPFRAGLLNKLNGVRFASDGNTGGGAPTPAPALLSPP